MSFLVIVAPKYTLAASHTAPLVSHGEYADGTDKQTDGPLHYAFRYGRGERNNRTYIQPNHGVCLSTAA